MENRLINIDMRKVNMSVDELTEKLTAILQREFSEGGFNITVEKATAAWEEATLNLEKETEAVLNEIRKIQSKITEKTPSYAVAEKKEYVYVVKKSTVKELFSSYNDSSIFSDLESPAFEWYHGPVSGNDELLQLIVRNLTAQNRASYTKGILKSLRQVVALLDTTNEFTEVTPQQNFLKNNKLPAPDDEEVNHSKIRFPIAVAEDLAKTLSLTDKEMAQILTISIRTYHRLKQKGLLNLVASERILLLKDLAAFGLEVFEVQGNFNKWLRLPLRELNDSSPLNLLDTTIGISRVKTVLGRIEYGIYS